MDKKPLSPTNDFVFHKVFGENMTVLRGFLQAVLDLPVEDYEKLEVVDPNLRPENIGDKLCILDIKLHTKSGKVIDIELQIKYQHFIWKRIQYYTAKMLAEQAKSGSQYENLPRVISILIADFVMIKESPAYHHRFRFYDEVNKVLFPDSMEINVLEIPKAGEGDASQVGEWLRFFAAREEEEFEMLSQTNPAIAEAWGVIKVLSGDERARYIAESRAKGLMDYESAKGEARREGRLEGLQEGRQEGRREEKLSFARNLLRENMSLEFIAKTTGLSPAEIQRLAAEPEQ
jgi:predicted transposase/invertase (TIGR01784 family)